jgi:hypothetical protein
LAWLGSAPKSSQVAQSHSFLFWGGFERNLKH